MLPEGLFANQLCVMPNLRGGLPGLLLARLASLSHLSACTNGALIGCFLGLGRVVLLVRPRHACRM